MNGEIYVELKELVEEVQKSIGKAYESGDILSHAELYQAAKVVYQKAGAELKRVKQAAGIKYK